MRKLFALLFVATVFTFAACEKKEQGAAGDTTAKDTMPATDPVPPVTDTTMKDTSVVDTTKK